eukprot:PhF_6_TR16972/c0_g1_i7/m.25653/K07937/ARF1; ADP-ribosylation factor 1
MFNLFQRKSQHRDSTKPAPILTIPHDSLLEIFSFVSDPVELHRLSLVCTLFRDICFDDNLWESHVRRHCLDSKTYNPATTARSMRSLFCAEVIHRGDLRTPSDNVLARVIHRKQQVGGIISKITSLFQKPRQYHIRLLGLDCAGKTTILYKLAPPGLPVESCAPIIGLPIESVTFHDMSILSWDIGGYDRVCMKRYWKLSEVCGVVWVIDSSDSHRMEESCSQLIMTIKRDELHGACVLILWNKCDYPSSISVEKGVALNEFHTILRDRKWFIQPCCAISGDGLWEGFAWLRSAILDC